MDFDNEIELLKKEFLQCEKILTALGEPIRQHIVLQMMNCNCQGQERCKGMRVGEITKLTNISRPAVSHHIGILREAGIIKQHRVGTMNFYHFDNNVESIDKLLLALTHTKHILQRLPIRSEDDD